MNVKIENMPEIKPVQGLSVRYTTPQDAEYHKKWLSDPKVYNAFPMEGEEEVEDAVRRWISFSRMRASLTVEMNNQPVGIATLYLQTYKRLVHQTEFGIILDENYRNKGIGTFLLGSLLTFAKSQFNISLIHLQVYQDNPAIRLYSRFGFKEFGRQNHWVKDRDQYVGRIFMEREI